MEFLMLVASSCTDTYEGCDSYDSPPPSPPPPFPPENQSKTNNPSKMIIIVVVLAATFLIVSFALIVKFNLRWFMSRRAAPQNNTNTHAVDDDDDTENQNRIHHIWFSTTVGLEESVINSIAVCKYNRGEGLIEGSECSVCLSEFCDGDNVRLLPKCNHAFHLPCIDTWLRSHVNCPLCRAGVVPNAATSSSTCPNQGSLVDVDETQMMNSEIDGMLERNQSRGIESDLQDVEAELDADDGIRDIEIGKDTSSSLANCGFLVYSDLSDNHRQGERAMELRDNELQLVRRSVSMDSLSASLMRIALTNHFRIDSEGSSSAIATQSRGCMNSGALLRALRPKKSAPNQNQSIFKMVGNSSKGAFLLRPILMKRSFSAGGKFLLPRSRRSRNSNLP